MEPSRRNQRQWGPALFFGAAAAATVFLLARPSAPDAAALAAQALWALFVGAAGVLILRTGRVSPWRAMLFVVIALGFLVRFKAGLWSSSGRLMTSDSAQEVPYCHIAMASSALNHLYQQYLALMSGSWSQWGPLSLGALWLVVTLSLGQAWCSWACFYGGIDDGLSRILPRPPVRWKRVPSPWRDFPTALLVFLLLVSLSSMLPVFCLWICPLKITTAFLDPVDAVRKAQMALMVATGTVFLVALPLLTGKRAFCGLLCPFGAWQSFFGRINPFRVSVDELSCTRCGACGAACPTFAIEEAADERPRILSYCNRCGQCLDACPHSSIRYTILGRGLSGAGSGWTSLWDARVVFVYCALTVSGSLGAVFVPAALRDLAAMLHR